MPTDRILQAGLAGIATAAMILVAACSNDTARADQAAGKTVKTDSAAGLVVGPTDQYASGRPGSAAVAVTVPRDSAAQLAPTGACEVAADAAASTRDAVVWLDGIHEGKALPRERRYQLESAGCALSPRVQAVAI